jgi:predicted  nucleic acid-binding Zn-ribbon protein
MVDDLQIEADRAQGRFRELRDQCRRLTEIVEHTQRFAEALSEDTDPSRREAAAELIEIVGVPD